MCGNCEELRKRLNNRILDNAEMKQTTENAIRDRDDAIEDRDYHITLAEELTRDIDEAEATIAKLRAELAELKKNS